MSKPSPIVFSGFCAEMGLPRPVSEHRFHPVRKWRFDYAWPERMIALEVEGGLWVRGRHNRPVGMMKDMDKYNAAAVLGWRILRIDPARLFTLELATTLKEILA